MAEAQHIDFSKLLGFDTVSDLMSDGVDFRDDILGAKLGAKVGTETLIFLSSWDSTPFVS